MTWRIPYRARALLALATLGLVPAAAQEGRMTLTVQLRTTEHPARAVSYAAVTILAAQTRQVLALGSTDDAGHASFQLAPLAVRVVIGGQHPDGRPLTLLGQDRDGIWVQLPSHSWLMDLRADTDGAVFPDLASVSAGAPDGAVATALAQGRPLPLVPTPTPLGPVSAARQPPVAEAASQATTSADPTPAHGQPAPPWASAVGVALLLALGWTIWTNRR